jgi:hypothetical protein
MRSRAICLHATIPLASIQPCLAFIWIEGTNPLNFRSNATFHPRRHCFVLHTILVSHCCDQNRDDHSIGSLSTSTAEIACGALRGMCRNNEVALAYLPAYLVVRIAWSSQRRDGEWLFGLLASAGISSSATKTWGSP